MELREPKHLPITLQSGKTKTFVLHKMPSTPARKIFTQYPLSSLPKIGDYETNEALMLTLIGFVCVITDDGSLLRLETRQLIDNHTEDWETLARLEYAQLEYNCSFLGAGKLLNYLGFAQNKLTDLIAQTLTGLNPQSSKKATPPKTN